MWCYLCTVNCGVLFLYCGYVVLCTVVVLCCLCAVRCVVLFMHCELCSVVYVLWLCCAVYVL